MNKGSFKYVWLLNMLEADRENDITIFTLFKSLTLPSAILPSLMPENINMISGTFQSHCGPLVVAFDTEQFENESFKREYQLGLELHQEDCMQQESLYFCSHVWFHGDNMLKLSLKVPWFKKSSGERKEDVHKIESIGTIVARSVEIGVAISSSPQNVTDEVNPGEKHYKFIPEAMLGENVGFKMKNVSVKDIRCGSVCSDYKSHPAKEACRFRVHVIIMNCPRQAAAGSTRSGDADIVDLFPKLPLCAELFTDYALLGTLPFVI
uniref:VASt domain-containing protein n=1 Tax=Angiostrongylus cantonensis TaxID=6313 RepID=A0A0K0CYR7_ANGCA